ncbi:MAG: carotenoid oxygenase family protein [Saprospiraceae bacterium]|nr:carotenoid oxygenase family protein [Saprospiraceae bacterium]
MNALPFLSATRQDNAFELQVLEGKIPEDLFGHVFINSPVGTVNSGGLPVPPTLPDGKPNPEYGNPVFNGDGYIYRFDLDEPGRITAKGALLKTPCYFADEATKYGTPYYEKGQQFRHLGLSRESFTWGIRNQINTAVNPFKFPGDNHTRLTANFDAGRPWEVDVDTLRLKTPIGKLSDWESQMPAFLNYVFPLNSSTAHPSFDPHTQELFTVNFTKDFDDLMGNSQFHLHIMKNPAVVEELLEDRLHELSAKVGHQPEKNKEHLRDFFRNIEKGIRQKLPLRVRLSQILLSAVEDVYLFFLTMGNLFVGKKFPRNAVYLLRWTGKDTVDKWEVVDGKTGKAIRIEETMHQTNITRDYIVLIDSAVKFAIDILLKNPFPHNENISRMIRDLTAKKILPYTPVYVISRKDLQPGQKTVPARLLQIEIETVHFSCDYDNPGGKITLHGAHNCANCAAEWVRSFDFLPAMAGQKVFPNTVGLITTGEMDIGRIGKFVIDGETAIIEQEELLIEMGFSGNSFEKGQVEGHTWAVGLHTHRGIISADIAVPRIKKIYWQSYGLDARFLTDFIQGLYTEYRNRAIPVEDLMKYYEKGIPFALLKQDTEKMTLEDWYVFGYNQNFRSLQFVPRKGANPDPNAEGWGEDGYIFCTMVNGSPDIHEDAYIREIWIFDAKNLRQGPVCRLAHPDLNFAFTIHSAWTPDCISSPDTPRIDIEQDFNAAIAGIPNKKRKKESYAFMQKHVYPQFKAYANGK